MIDRIVESFRCAFLNKRIDGHAHSIGCLPHDGKHGPCFLC